jgi:hypothetical protein
MRTISFKSKANAVASDKYLFNSERYLLMVTPARS